METKRNKITAEDYRIYKQMLKSPEDDKLLRTSLGLPVRTAREIRLSRNYRDFKRKIKQQKKYESLIAKTKLAFEEVPQSKDHRTSDRLDREAEHTSRLVGWMGLGMILLFILLVVWGIVGSINNVLGCR